MKIGSRVGLRRIPKWIKKLLLKNYIIENLEKTKRVIEKEGYSFWFSNEKGDITNYGDGKGYAELPIRIYIPFSIKEVRKILKEVEKEVEGKSK